MYNNCNDIFYSYLEFTYRSLWQIIFYLGQFIHRGRMIKPLFWKASWFSCKYSAFFWTFLAVYSWLHFGYSSCCNFVEDYRRRQTYRPYFPHWISRWNREAYWISDNRRTSSAYFAHLMYPKWVSGWIVRIGRTRNSCLWRLMCSKREVDWTDLLL